MAATDFIWGGYPVTGGDLPVKNTDGTNDLVAGDTVTVDGTNVLSGSQGAVGVVRSTTNDAGIGICLEAIKKGALGRVRVYGAAVGRASGAITAGARVQCDATGALKTLAAGQPQVGIALSTTTTNLDPILVLLDRANNA